MTWSPAPRQRARGRPRVEAPALPTEPFERAVLDAQVYLQRELTTEDRRYLWLLTNGYGPERVDGKYVSLSEANIAAKFFTEPSWQNWDESATRNELRELLGRPLKGDPNYVPITPAVPSPEIKGGLHPLLSTIFRSISRQLVLPNKWMFPTDSSIAITGLPCGAPGAKAIPLRDTDFRDLKNERFTLAEMFRRAALWLCRPIPLHLYMLEVPVAPHPLASYEATRHALHVAYSATEYQSDALPYTMRPIVNNLKRRGFGLCLAIWPSHRSIRVLMLTEASETDFGKGAFEHLRRIEGPHHPEDLEKFLGTLLDSFMEYFPHISEELNDWFVAHETDHHTEPGIFSRKQLHRTLGLARKLSYHRESGGFECTTPDLHDDAHPCMGKAETSYTVRPRPSPKETPVQAVNRAGAQMATKAFLIHAPLVPRDTAYDAVCSSPYLRLAVKLGLIPIRYEPPPGRLKAPCVRRPHR